MKENAVAASVLKDSTAKLAGESLTVNLLHGGYNLLIEKKIDKKKLIKNADDIFI